MITVYDWQVEVKTMLGLLNIIFNSSSVFSNKKKISLIDLFKFGTVKVKCTAMLGDVYMKSNEISFEVKAPPNAPALESREKNGKKLRGKMNEEKVYRLI